MEITGTINVLPLLQQIREKEDKDSEYAKQIKKCESIIKTEEEKIKQLFILKPKLADDLETKIIEYSKQETTHEIIQQKRLIWIDLLERTRKELKEEEERRDELSRSICLNRISFYDNIKHYLQKHNFLEISCGLVKRNVPPQMTVVKQIKIEKYSDEEKSLTVEINNLETQLKQLEGEEARIEEAKLYKAKLQSEPSCGENFVRCNKQNMHIIQLQNLLKDMKDKMDNLEMETKAVKNDIAQKELLLLKRKNIARKTEFRMSNIHDVSKKVPIQCNVNVAASSQSIEQKRSRLKAVQFKNTVEMKQNPASPKLKSIIKCRDFIHKSQSPSMRKKLHGTVVSKLDEEMKEILFKTKE